jgi:predicted RNA binding protein YcfA (HicA-like mRNA interferase family)
MGFDDYKIVLYRQDDCSWVAEIPALGGCYALMDTREAALAELEQVFAMNAQEHQDRGQALPKDTTESCMLSATAREFQRAALALGFVRRRQTGSHERWMHSDGRSVTIPLHGGREIGPPLFFKILRQLSVSLEEFDRLR